MDLKQTKLTRTEWDSIETPVSPDEKIILDLIVRGYENVQIKENETSSLFTFTKVEKTPEIELFLYKKYFEPIIEKIAKTAKLDDVVAIKNKDNALKKLKSIDSMRLKNLETNIDKNRTQIFEFLLLDLCSQFCNEIDRKSTKINQSGFYLYTLIQLKKSTIAHINSHVVKFVDFIVEKGNQRIKLSDVIENAYEFIERNPYLIKYEDRQLYTHQKQLFSLFRRNQSTFTPKLVLYIAPTGTGKTLSPLGLSCGSIKNEITDENGDKLLNKKGEPILAMIPQRVIFVCVARHIGLALAKSAISIEKKIAFAFGCETASDIRLHYYAAVNYTKNDRSGGIGKVDNSIGSNVEIMICDVQSYLVAMHYMLAFNEKENIVTYWDEPTISMDYTDHELHGVIHKNWVENQIPNVVLSCATLPKESEILPTISDFKERFDCAEIISITSYDCRKSISIVNRHGFSVLPHTLFSQYNELMECVAHCQENMTLLRYFDLNEIVRFLVYINRNQWVDPAYQIDGYFANISEITMNSLKLYYLDVLRHLSDPAKWGEIHNYMTTTHMSKFEIRQNNNNNMKKSYSLNDGDNSKNKISGHPLSRSFSVDPSNRNQTMNQKTGVFVTTSDAYTLTDGPTIFITEDVMKIGQFYIQQSKIPETIFKDILQKINKNSELSERIAKLERLLEDKSGVDVKANKSSSDKTDKGEKRKVADIENMSGNAQSIHADIDRLRSEIQYISMDAKYIPNTKPHQEIWIPGHGFQESAFVANIDERVVKSIMSIDVDNTLKLLLLLGIGVFLESPQSDYIEILKELAVKQRLFMIIAASDYIYGTNYQFCHGFIGKDLENMTQQKTIQAMGRIGRNNIQQSYTVRFRDDEMIANLFKRPAANLEAENMCRLFTM